MHVLILHLINHINGSLSLFFILEYLQYTINKVYRIIYS